MSYASEVLADNPLMYLSFTTLPLYSEGTGSGNPTLAAGNKIITVFGAGPLSNDVAPDDQVNAAEICVGAGGYTDIYGNVYTGAGNGMVAQYLDFGGAVPQQNILTLEFWLNWPNFTNDGAAFSEYGTSSGANPFFFTVVPNDIATSSFVFGFLGQFPQSGKFWTDGFPWPTPNVWHHIVLIMDGTGPTNTAYVDNIQQTLTAKTHTITTTGYFVLQDFMRLGFGYREASPGSVASYATPSAQFAQVALYSGILPANRIAAHYFAANPSSPSEIASGPQVPDGLATTSG